MVNIVNIVASGDLGRELALLQVSQDLTSFANSVEYDPEVFSGLQLRFQESGPLIVLYSTGKYTIMGAKSWQQLDGIYSQLESALTELGIDITSESSRPVVRNLVCKEDIGMNIDLNALTVGLGVEKVEYEPEQSPFVYYWPDELDCLITIPTNGQIIVTGIVDIAEAEKAVKIFQAKIDDMFSM